jgi:hypothetical protein
MLTILGIIFWVAVLPVIHWTLNGTHPILESLRQYLAANLQNIISVLWSHLTALMSGLGLLFVGFITTRPKPWPRNGQEWYEWVGNAFEAALPGRFGRNNGNNHDPVPPAPKEEIKP